MDACVHTYMHMGGDWIEEGQKALKGKSSKAEIPNRPFPYLLCFWVFLLNVSWEPTHY